MPLTSSHLAFLCPFERERDLTESVTESFGEHLPWQRLNAIFCTRALTVCVKVIDGLEQLFQVHLWRRGPTIVRWNFWMVQEEGLNEVIFFCAHTHFYDLLRNFPSSSYPLQKNTTALCQVDRNMHAHTLILLPSSTRWPKMDADLGSCSCPPLFYTAHLNQRHNT